MPFHFDQGRSKRARLLDRLGWCASARLRGTLKANVEARVAAFSAVAARFHQVVLRDPGFGFAASGQQHDPTYPRRHGLVDEPTDDLAGAGDREVGLVEDVSGADSLENGLPGLLVSPVTLAFLLANQPANSR
jgi:hypothetical protein